MANTFHLRIVCSNRIFFDGQAQAIIVPTIDGEYEVMAHHAPAGIAVETGEIRLKHEDGTGESAVITPGFLETVHNRTQMYVYTCERLDEIDERRAVEAKERAEEQLRQKQSQLEYYHSRASVARAMARLKAVSKYRSGK